MLFELIRFFGYSQSNYGDDTGAMHPASSLISRSSDIFSPLSKLLHEFDPATVDAQMGGNALHILFASGWFESVDDWDYVLAEMLITCGVSVHMCNKQGQTPLLTFAETIMPNINSILGLQLLMAYGSDINAQDNDGDGLLHLLVRGQALDVLESLFMSDAVNHLDFALCNSANKTAIDVALTHVTEMGNDTIQYKPHAENQDGTLAWQIYRLMMTQKMLWVKHARPVLLRYLESVLPVNDVAKMVLAYVDGSGPEHVDKAQEE